MGGHLSKPPLPETPVFQASCGPVRGKVYGENEQAVDAYLGIPYGKYVGRFERAEPAEVWKTPLNCTEYGPRTLSGGCLIKGLKLKLEEHVHENNCLTLNVFVPRLQSSDQESNPSKRPVIVFIHSSDFQYGSACDYDSKLVAGLLPQKGVIVVTLTFRVGVFGFFTTGDDKCKGNFGLWDQALALQWVKKHIESFNGDSKNITVLGDGAGAASAELLALSPHSRDLFQKLILMSGSASSRFAIRTKKEQADIYHDYAISLGFNENASNTSKLLSFFLEKHVCTITSFDDRKKYHNLMNAPNLDGDFFPKPLNELRKEAPKKSVIIGVSDNENVVFPPQFKSGQRSQEEKFKKAIEWVFDVDDYDNAEKIHEEVFTKYKADEYPREDSIPNVKEFLADYQFKVPALECAREAVNAGWEVYFYVFSAAKDCFMWVRDIVNQKVHTQSNSTEKLSNEKMLGFFTNFAKSGDPNTPNENLWWKYSLEHPSLHFRIESKGKEKMECMFPGVRCHILEPLRSLNKSRRAIFDGK